MNQHLDSFLKELRESMGENTDKLIHERREESKRYMERQVYDQQKVEVKESDKIKT